MGSLGLVALVRQSSGTLAAVYRRPLWHSRWLIGAQSGKLSPGELHIALSRHQHRDLSCIRVECIDGGCFLPRVSKLTEKDPLTEGKLTKNDGRR